MASTLAIDTNLTLLLVVGRAERGLITRHKRLSAFTEADYQLLLGFIAIAPRVVTTPNALTEISNLAAFGITDPARSRIVASVATLTETLDEVYFPSREITRDEAFDRLGLADCAWLSLLDRETQLLTTDQALFIEATRRGFDAVNFRYVQDSLRSR